MDSGREAILASHSGVGWEPLRRGPWVGPDESNQGQSQVPLASDGETVAINIFGRVVHLKAPNLNPELGATAAGTDSEMSGICLYASGGSTVARSSYLCIYCL